LPHFVEPPLRRNRASPPEQRRIEAEILRSRMEPRLWRCASEEGW